MHRIGKFMIASACAVVVATVAGPGTSVAKSLECNATYTNTKLKGPVVVNPGDTCILDDVTVIGGLTVNGGAISVTNSTIHGGWSITGDVNPLSYMCGNDIVGGLSVHHVTSNVTLAFGEANATCPGGTITGGVTVVNNHAMFIEIDGYQINGGLTILDTSAGELEGTSVNGTATCQPGLENEEGGPNTYSGPNDGCPA